MSQKPLDASGYVKNQKATKTDTVEVMDAYREQVCEYLKTYTSGDTNTLVILNNPANALKS